MAAAAAFAAVAAFAAAGYTGAAAGAEVRKTTIDVVDVVAVVTAVAAAVVVADAANMSTMRAERKGRLRHCLSGWNAQHSRSDTPAEKAWETWPAEGYKMSAVASLDTQRDYKNPVAARSAARDGNWTAAAPGTAGRSADTLHRLRSAIASEHTCAWAAAGTAAERSGCGRRVAADYWIAAAVVDSAVAAVAAVGKSSDLCCSAAEKAPDRTL